MSKMADNKPAELLPRSRKKVSKRTKKSWRKNTDVEDIEQHLEDVRQEERTGGIIAEKADKDLFFVETGVHEHISSSKKEKIIDDDSLSDEEKYVPAKVKKQMKWKEEYEKEKKHRSSSRICPVSDVWSIGKDDNTSPQDPYVADTLPKNPKFSTNSVTSESIPDYFLMITQLLLAGEKPKTVGERVSLLPAVELSEGGQSYNPEYEDHQGLLLKAHQVEEEKVAKMEKLQKKFSYLTPEELAKKPTWIEEMSEGLKDTAESGSHDHQDQVGEDNAEEEDPKGTITTDRAERKTRKKRRKEKDEKEQKRKAQVEKEKRKRLNEVFRIKGIRKEIQESEKKKAERQAERKLKEEKKLNIPKRLGKQKFEEQNIPLKLSEELVGTLRELKPEGNLLHDRFKSLQKRNIIEPRKRVIPHRKYKKKEYEKRSYRKPTVKEFTEIQSSRKRP